MRATLVFGVSAVFSLSACGKLVEALKKDDAPAPSATTATITSAASSVSAAPTQIASTPSASATPSAAPSASAAELKCPSGTFKILEKNGKKMTCYKPCSADDDCKKGEACEELSKLQDPQGKHGAMFCMPSGKASSASSAASAASASSAKKSTKCPSGEVLVQGRYEPMCARPCKKDADCKGDGPCQAGTEDTDVCAASAHPLR